MTANPAFDTAYLEQMENVIDGWTADRSGKHALWPLPDMRMFERLREMIIEVSLWTLYSLDHSLRAHEDVRTYVIWITAVHMGRLTHKGYRIENAAREIRWMNLIALERLEFLPTSSFARKLMPTRLMKPPPPARAVTRKKALDILRTCQCQWRPRDLAPATVAFDAHYAMKSYSTPEHFLTNPHLAPRWIDHIADVICGRDTDHGYWIQIAKRERKVYAFFIDEACKATLESHQGQLERLIVHGPADDVVYDRLAFALGHTTHVTGDTFELPKESVNPAVLSLLATNARHVRDVREAVAKAKASAEWKKPEEPAVKKSWRRNTDVFLAYVVLFIALSYLVPLSIISAPTFVQRYIHVWRAALGIEPTCMSSARTDCVAGSGNSPIPIPPHSERPHP